MISNEELANEILKYRAINDMSQEKLAKEIGIMQRTLSLIENMKISPSNKTKTKILLYIREEK